MKIALTFQKNRELQQITVGDIIRCKDFSYGIFYKESQQGISVGWTESNYKAFLRAALKSGNGLDAYDLSRGDALFLVLSMELVEVALPEDVVDENTHYLGINVKCIRIDSNKKLSRDSERIFFTLCHPMSCLDLSKRKIEIIKHLDLPIFWNQKSEEGETVEKPF